MNEQSPVPSGSRLALGVLVVLVVLSPWPFGSAHPFTRWLISVVCLLTATGIALSRLRRGEGTETPAGAALAAGFFVFGLAQLIPLPAGLHTLLAPGSAALWHPDVPAAARVLGDGPRPVSIWPGATRSAVGLGLGVVALATLSMPALRDRRRARRALSAVVGSGVAVAVYALIARLLFGDKLFGMLSVPTVAPFGPFVSKNHFAGYAAMHALLALGLALELVEHAERRNGPLGWLEGRQARRIVFALGGAAVLCLSVLVSLSRGGALALAAGVIVLATMRSFGTRRRALPVILAVAASIAALLAIPHDARDRLRSTAHGREDAATVYRLGTWRDSIRLAAASPLVGHGLGTFVDGLPRFKTGAGDLSVEHAENDYLEVLTEGGLVGMGLAIAACVALARAPRRRPKDAAGPPGRGLAQGAAAGLVALGVHSLVDFNLRIPSNALLCALLAATLVSQSVRSQGRRLPTLGLLVVCAATLSVVGRPGFRDLPEVYRTLTVATPLRLALLEASLQEHLRKRPADAEAWVWLGWTRTVPRADEQAIALVGYGAGLDPQRKALGAVADELTRRPSLLKPSGREGMEPQRRP
jgi:O-antigen ligase